MQKFVGKSLPLILEASSPSSSSSSSSNQVLNLLRLVAASAECSEAGRRFLCITSYTSNDVCCTSHVTCSFSAAVIYVAEWDHMKEAEQQVNLSVLIRNLHHCYSNRYCNLLLSNIRVHSNISIGFNITISVTSRDRAKAHNSSCKTQTSEANAHAAT